MAKKNRADRWNEATAAARVAFDAIKEAIENANARLEEVIQGVRDELEEAIDEHSGKLSNAMDEIRSIQEEYNEWYGNMPEGLQNSATGEKLSTIEGMDLSVEFELADASASPEFESNIDEVESALDEAEGADLPMGYGKD